MNQTENNLKSLFKPSSIAIVGASEKEGKVGNAVAKNVLERGYKGNVFLVNPKHEKMFGQKCYSALNEIEEDVDLAIVIVPAKIVNNVIEEASDKIRNFVVISAGFSETGKEGKKREDDLAKIAEKNNLNILGPNCLGFIVPDIRLNASFAGGMPTAGNIALISQSGALAVALLDIAEKEGMSFSNIISIGNKVQVGEVELIQYLADDPNTKAIGIYLEGITDGEKFINVIKKVSDDKPIVILKAGKTEKAQKAITTHTGSLAGSDDVMSAAFNELGILRVDNLESFLNLLRLISAQEPPKNEKTAIITNAGGPGVLTTDAFEGKSIKTAEFNEDIKKRLREFLPEESSVENPVDLLGDAQEDRYKKTLDVIGEGDSGCVICVLTPQDQTPVDKITEEIIRFKKKTNKTVATVFIGGDRVSDAVSELEKNGIYNFSFPNQAVGALSEYYKWKVFKDANTSVLSAPLNDERMEKVAEIVKRAQSEERIALTFPEAKEVMGMYGIESSEGDFLAPDDQIVTDLEFPVVVKVDSDKVLHKTDKNGVILDVKNQEELREAMEKIRSSFPGEAVLIQPMEDVQTEIILGIKKDETFGPVLLFGLGGIYTEVFEMVDFLIPPLGIEGVKKALLKSKIGFLFEGARAQNPYDINEIAVILLGLIHFSQEMGDIKGLDINPLLIYNNDKNAIAVDVKIII